MISVRPAAIADIPAMIRLNNQVQDVHATLVPALFKNSKDYDPLPALQTFVTDSKFTTLVACDGDLPVGYISMVLKDSPGGNVFHPRRYAFIHHIVVSDTSQRQGVGKALLDAVRKIARDFGATRLELDVWTMNTPARQFFLAQGLRTFKEYMEVEL